MKLLEYHEDINSYVTTYYLYQVLIKPFNNKLTKINLKERIKLTTIILIFGTINILILIVKALKGIKKT